MPVKETKRPPRIRACLSEETEKEFLHITIEAAEDLEKLSEWIDVPIMECKTKGGLAKDMVIDVKHKVVFYQERLRNEDPKT